MSDCNILCSKYLLAEIHNTFWENKLHFQPCEIYKNVYPPCPPYEDTHEKQHKINIQKFTGAAKLLLKIF